MRIVCTQIESGKMAKDADAVNRIEECLNEGLQLHSDCNPIYENHSVLAIALHAHFVRLTVQELNPGVWEYARDIAEAYEKVQTLKVEKDGGH